MATVVGGSVAMIVILVIALLIVLILVILVRRWFKMKKVVADYQSDVLAM